MAYAVTTPKIGVQPIAVTSTVQNHALGTVVRAVDPTYGEGEFIYLQGVASTVIGDVVAYNMASSVVNGVEQGTTTLSVLATRGPVAIAMSANVASQYGWYQIVGNAQVLTSIATAITVPVYATATAGQVSAAVTAASKIDGLVFTVATAGNALGTAQIAFPALNANG